MTHKYISVSCNGCITLLYGIRAQDICPCAYIRISPSQDVAQPRSHNINAAAQQG